MQKEISRLHGLRLLELLLIDKTSKGHIIWATDAYSQLGQAYGREKEITAEALLQEPFRLMSRAEKAKEAQTQRTRAYAEVFTPFWVVKKMNDYMEAEWFGYEGAFAAERVSFPSGKSWQQYVDSRRLEITCGEAPYLVSRYDVASGEAVPVPDRVGILDRKLRVVTENTQEPEEWLNWAYRAYQASYGYEFQGDNLLLARLNLLLAFEEGMEAKLGRRPSRREYKKLATIIAWNIWQMDGLSGTIPYCRAEREIEEQSLFPELEMEEVGPKQPPCRVYDWRANRSLMYTKLREGKGR